MSTTGSPGEHERAGGFGWLPRGDEPGAAAHREANLEANRASAPDAGRVPDVAAAAHPPPHLPAPRRTDPATVQSLINWGLAALLLVVGALVTFETARELRTSIPSGTLSTSITPATVAPKASPTAVPRVKPPVKAVAPLTTTTQVPVTTPVTSPPQTTPATSPPRTTPRTTPPQTTPPPVVRVETTPPQTTPAPIVVPSSPTTTPSGTSDTIAVPFGPNP